MAILTVCVNKQRKRKDGCYSVYIRVNHNGKPDPPDRFALCPRQT